MNKEILIDYLLKNTKFKVHKEGYSFRFRYRENEYAEITFSQDTHSVRCSIICWHDHEYDYPCFSGKIQTIEEFKVILKTTSDHWL